MRAAATTLLLLAFAAPLARPAAGAGCDESFPLAPPARADHTGNPQDNPRPVGALVGHPSDPTRRTYGPLCTSMDGTRRLDARRLQRCPPDHCWVDGAAGGCFHATSQECRHGINNENGNGNVWNGSPNGNSGTWSNGEAEREAPTPTGDRCPANMCYLAAYQGCFHLTSYECNADITFNARPTPQPTYRMVETTLPVKLTLNNVPEGYGVTKEVQSSILRWVHDTLEEELEGTDLTLVRVEYAGRLEVGKGPRPENDSEAVGVKGPRPDEEETNESGSKYLDRQLRGSIASSPPQRRLAQVDVALRVTVRGPDDEIDFALSVIMELVRAEFADLVSYLKKNGGSVAISNVGGDVVGDASGGGDEVISVNPFDNVEMGADVFDFEDVRTGPTARPTEPPTQVTDPSPAGVAVKVTDEGMNVVIEDATVAMPWWGWLVLVLSILLLCLCCICGCWRRRRSERRNKKAQAQMLQVWMGADPNKERWREKNRRRSSGDRGSVAGARRTSRAQRPPRRIKVADSSCRMSPEDELARQRPVRRKSSAEAEEEEREFQERLRDDAESRTVISRPPKRQVGGEKSAGAKARDPPEELALIPYNSKLTDPDGSKVTRCASLYAADVYYGKSDIDLSAVDDSTIETQPPQGKGSSKANMFLCSLDELTEDVQAVARSATTEPSRDEEPVAVKRKKRKKKKKKKSGKQKYNGAAGTNRTEGATEKLRNSLRGSKPGAIVVNSLGKDEPSLITMPHDLRGQRELEEGFRSERRAWKEESSTKNAIHDNESEGADGTVEWLASDDDRQREETTDDSGNGFSRKGSGSKFATLLRRVSRGGVDSSDDGSSRGQMSAGSLGSEDIGL